MTINKGTVIRTVLLLLALANQLLALWGKSPLPFEEETVTQLVSFGFTAVTAAVSWWKNNSFTQAAIAADEYLSELRGTDL